MLSFVQILDKCFTAEMQKLQGHALEDRDLGPPRAVCDARAVLSKDPVMGSRGVNESIAF